MALSECQRGGDPAGEECAVDRFFFPGEKAQANLRLGIVKAARKPGFPAIENIGDADLVLGSFDALDGAGKNPGMAVQHGALPALFEVDKWHAGKFSAAGAASCAPTFCG